jgi:hypothetical protein
MSAIYRISGIPVDAADGPGLTQSVNRKFFGLDRFGLVSPPNPVLETIRNQTLPGPITDKRVSSISGSDMSAYFGGFADVVRMMDFSGF